MAYIHFSIMTGQEVGTVSWRAGERGEFVSVYICMYIHIYKYICICISVAVEQTQVLANITKLMNSPSTLLF